MFTKQTNRVGRRRRAKADGRQPRSAARGLVAVTATATLGAAMLGGVAQAHAADNPLAGLGLGDITALLENELLKDYITICDNPDGSTPVLDADAPAVAVVDCSQSTGTGIAIVLPDSVEIGTAAEGMTYKLPIYGTRNFIQIVSMLALNDYIGSPAYSTYEKVQRDAALEPEIATADTCVKSNGDRYKPKSIIGCLLDTKVKKGEDFNTPLRKNALKVAEYLTGHKYGGYDQPVILPGKVDPVGSATVIGPGTQLAAAMTGGTALAETGHKLGIATAGAGGGRISSAFTHIGMANALNLDTDQIKLTWFGQELDFTKLRGNAVVDLIGGDNLDALDEIENLKIPALKEVSCFGVYATATAEGLGSCTNLLGTLDMYKDERAAKVGESRQTQYGLTDITSLVLGNNALLKQLGGTAESTPFMDSLMDNLTSEEGRLKFAKDFVRYTQDVKTVAVQVPVLDEDGKPVLDYDGQQVLEPVLDEEGNPVTKTVTAAYLTSDYGLRTPITIEWLGHRVVLFPAVTVNGEERPNYLSLPQIEKIVADADSGEMPKVSVLPKVSLIQWDNPFGLGTLTLDKPFNPVHTIKDYLDTVTIVDDIKGAGDLLGGLTGDGSDGATDDSGVETETPGEEAPEGETAPEAPAKAVSPAATGTPAAAAPAADPIVTGTPAADATAVPAVTTAPAVSKAKDSASEAEEDEELKASAPAA